MSETDAESQNLELKKLETEQMSIKYSLYKVIFGTLIVGVVGVFLPFVIEFIGTYRVQTNEHRLYVDKYINTAINSNIDVRIRTAEYFSYMSDEKVQGRWEKYYKFLQEIKSETITDMSRLEDGKSSANFQITEYLIELAPLNERDNPSKYKIILDLISDERYKIDYFKNELNRLEQQLQNIQ